MKILTFESKIRGVSGGTPGSRPPPRIPPGAPGECPNPGGPRGAPGGSSLPRPPHWPFFLHRRETNCTTAHWPVDIGQWPLRAQPPTEDHMCVGKARGCREAGCVWPLLAVTACGARDENENEMKMECQMKSGLGRSTGLQGRLRRGGCVWVEKWRVWPGCVSMEPYDM